MDPNFRRPSASCSPQVLGYISLRNVYTPTTDDHVSGEKYTAEIVRGFNVFHVYPPVPRFPSFAPDADNDKSRYYSADNILFRCNCPPKDINSRNESADNSVCATRISCNEIWNSGVVASYSRHVVSSRTPFLDEPSVGCLPNKQKITRFPSTRSNS